MNGTNSRPSATPWTPLALGLLVPALLWSAACGPAAEEGVAEEDLLARLPSPVTAVAWADLDALRTNPLTAPLFEEKRRRDEAERQSPAARKGLQEAMAAAGIDARRDLHEVAAAAFVAEDGTAVPVAAARATFDRPGLEAALAARPTLEYRDATLYFLGAAEAPEPAEPEEGEDRRRELYLTIAPDGLLLIGHLAALEAALDVAAEARSSVAEDEELAATIAGLGAGLQAWVVADAGALRDQLRTELPGDEPMPVPRQALEGLELLTLSVRAHDALDVQLRARAAGAEDARLLADALRGMAAMGKMMLQQRQPEAFAILDRGLAIDSAEQELRVELTLTGEDLETLRRLAGEGDG